MAAVPCRVLSPSPNPFVFVLAVLSLPRFPNIMSIHALSPITTYRAFVYRPAPFGATPVSCLPRRTIPSTFTHYSLVLIYLSNWGPTQTYLTPAILLLKWTDVPPDPLPTHGPPSLLEGPTPRVRLGALRQYRRVEPTAPGPRDRRRAEHNMYPSRTTYWRPTERGVVWGVSRGPLAHASKLISCQVMATQVARFPVEVYDVISAMPSASHKLGKRDQIYIF
ncbi:hypothetical protein B0H14DRAFT_3166382 [Mycena olivaceomarginata]|nr:hypothetical protein B0H14DRAFT_3166382 [Mycena olivaceomarginata]